MGSKGSIVISDWSAYHFYCHVDSPSLCGAVVTALNPLSAQKGEKLDFANINCNHPLYGGTPVTILVGELGKRRTSEQHDCRYCGSDLPKGSFLKLKKGLYITSPELTYARLACCVSEIRLAEIGTNLCGRFFINLDNGKLPNRTKLLTSPEKLESYLQRAKGLRGAAKARKALSLVLGNSASPMETKTMLQFCAPLRKGGFNLPLREMNYEVRQGRGALVSDQDKFSLDLVNSDLKVCIEYDGEECHRDASKDKRRRNALVALGWEVFPLDKEVLFNPVATEHFANQVARYLGLRIRKPRCWDEKFVELRRSLDLPV